MTERFSGEPIQRYDFTHRTGHTFGLSSRHAGIERQRDEPGVLAQRLMTRTECKLLIEGVKRDRNEVDARTHSTVP